MQISLQDAFITKKPDILKPAQGNNTSSYRPIQESNMSVTRKRSFSQQNGSLATVFNANSAFQENVPPQTIGDPPSNGVSALHDAVYFDDADFSDDGDLDFDTSAPILYPSLSKAAAALPSPPRQPQQQPQQRQQQQQQKQTSGQISPPRRQAVDTYEDLEFPPQRPQHPQPPYQQEPPSSAPVLWSSSPVEHLQPAKRRSNPKLEEVVEEAEPPKKKPRTFPWLKGQEVVTEETAPAKPASTGRKVGKRNSSNDLHQPWNEPFSNIEAGKKEARKRNAAKQQKRAFTTASDDPEEVRKVRKGKEPIAGIFLSDEQKKVVDLVTNSKKPQSVFFTGSAGKCSQVLGSLSDHSFLFDAIIETVRCKGVDAHHYMVMGDNRDSC
jgi:ATP-dependent DNA helicase PIF1